MRQADLDVGDYLCQLVGEGGKEAGWVGVWGHRLGALSAAAWPSAVCVQVNGRSTGSRGPGSQRLPERSSATRLITTPTTTFRLRQVELGEIRHLIFGSYTTFRLRQAELGEIRHLILGSYTTFRLRQAELGEIRHLILGSYTTFRLS